MFRFIAQACCKLVPVIRKIERKSKVERNAIVASAILKAWKRKVKEAEKEDSIF